MKFRYLVSFSHICYFMVYYDMYQMSHALFSHFSLTTEMDSLLVLNFARRKCILKGWEKSGVTEIANSDKPLPPVDPFEEIYRA